MQRVAALLALAMPVGAPAQEAAPRDFSLVIARVTGVGGIVPLQFDQGCDPEGCPRPIGSFDRTETLFGKPMPAEFMATADMPLTDFWRPRPPGRPAILVVERLPYGRYEVVTFAFADTVACLDRSNFETLDWHPAGQGILQREEALCADVRHLARAP
ncbi:hypothetical protein IAG41_04565 [Sphingomonas sp. JC676]|uniref:hypothetical protein n=1 Tax=Sphingomonas sp. JC676 TaxID=2768065 RepID=UPI001658015C|nr:hypothetical protein [Sphingomonas sp. JC676]MBC9031657.1 hypothetical protein [Sphingomonas sp. JC676]